MIYGYMRVSTKTQSIERQERNIKEAFPEADTHYRENYTGTKMDRPQWQKLMKKVRPGDTIVFDSVSRMSRNADEGIATYFDLYDRGVNLVFLKERYIDTDTYKGNLKDRIELTGEDEDEIFIGINNYFRKLAKKQIRIAFDQAEKEVNDLHERTKEGMRVKGAGEKIAEARTGKTYERESAKAAKAIIQKHAKRYGGTLNDTECMRQAGVSRATYYRFVGQIDRAIVEDDNNND